MLRRISIRGCVRPQIRRSLRPVLFLKVRSTHTRRILCRVSGLVPSLSISFFFWSFLFAAKDSKSTAAFHLSAAKEGPRESKRCDYFIVNRCFTHVIRTSTIIFHFLMLFFNCLRVSLGLCRILPSAEHRNIIL